MRLTAPTFIVFLISLICGVLALLPVLGIAVVALPISTFWLMTIAWGLLLAGVLFRGV
jgi:predicted PurR-regulated permease PerM|tara:strand:+ start:291 stop:464 length:174 start_codon:yes stop_codon:yes gene_type:complete